MFWDVLQLNFCALSVPRTPLVLTQYKGHGDETGVVVAINCKLFKIPLLVII